LVSPKIEEEAQATVGVGLGVRDCVAVGVEEGLANGVEVPVGEGEALRVGLGVVLGEAVPVALAVAVRELDGLAVGVGLGLPKHESTDRDMSSKEAESRIPSERSSF
jgi:hypothetical protein